MKNQLKIGAILTYFTLLLGNAIALLYTPFMLRKLGQSEFGLFSLANAVVGYLTILDFGFGSATIRYTAKYKAENQLEKANSMYGMFIVLYAMIGVLTFVLGFVLSLFADRLFAKGLSVEEIKIVRRLLILASINLAVSFPFGVFTSIITAYEKFVFLKINTLVRQCLNPLIYVPVLLLGYKSTGLIVASSILNLSFLLINLIYCFVKLRIRIDFKKFDWSLLKEIITYSVWIFVGNIVFQLWWNAGQFLLGIYASSIAIAIYSLAMQFKSYFESFATAISGVFLPRMTTMASNGASNEEFSDYFIKVGRLQYIVVALVTTGFILFGKQFIAVWAGPDYAQAFYITIMLFIPLSLIDTQTLGITILQAKNKHKFRAVLYLCVVVVCIVISIPFIKLYGALGCMCATVAALVIGNLLIMNWYYSRKIGLNIKKYWLELLKMTPGIIFITVISFFVIKFIPTLDRYKVLLPAMLIYCVLYFIVLYFLSFNDYEKNLFKNLFRKIARR
ncbi:MAG: oligosaccharide flippase family protein [Treponema sp.]|nr:oligosaccharide flippase family protein [Treponema sp.]